MIFEDEREFFKYREANKHMRFWDCLKSFAGVDAILIRDGDAIVDTEYFQNVKIK